MPDRLAVTRQPGRSVGEVAEVLLLADRQAQIRVGAQAVHALAALGREQSHHQVTRRQRGDALADTLDESSALVAEHGRRVPRRIDSRRGVHVGVADPARGEPHEDLARPRLGEIDLGDAQRRGELLQHGGSDLQRAAPSR